jgi:leucine dehydrogenase
MKTLENVIEMGHENILYCYDEETGLKAIIAVHDTTLGPAIGGTRFYDYANEDEALYDVLRLSKGMTYKNAAAGLKIGGGKAVIIGDPKKIKTPELLKKYGQFVNRLNGNYYTAEDMNRGCDDVDHINSETPYCVGRPSVSGNPSPYTARGVYQGIRACAKEVFGTDDLKGRTINVTGVGSVGMSLVSMLHADGANVTVADVYAPSVEKAVAEFGVKTAEVSEIHKLEADIFAPCAMGAIINVDNADEYNCKIIAGAANNVLVNDAAGDKLHELGILYGPDYIVNAGGIINCALEIAEGGWSKEKAEKLVDGVYDNVAMVIKMAKERNVPTYKAADEYALSIIAAAKACK